MALTKVTYVDGVTVIGAENLNAIQDEVISTASSVATKQDALTFDTTPTAGSTNPVTSGGIRTAIDNAVGSIALTMSNYTQYTNMRISNGKYVSSSGYRFRIIPCGQNWSGLIVGNKTALGINVYTAVAFLTSGSVTSGADVPFSLEDSNLHTIYANETKEFTLPSDCTHIYVMTRNTGHSITLEVSAVVSNGVRLMIEAETNGTYPKFPTYSDIASHFNSSNVLAESFEIDVNIDPNDVQTYVLTMEAKYTTGDTNIPYIRFYGYSSANAVQLYTSPSYLFESNTEYVRQSWRLPNGSPIGRYRFNFVIPAGTTLAVRTFSVYPDNSVRPESGGIVFHAHEGFDAIYPESYDSIVAASELGFQSCIVIPKFTSDGVPVCFHNDGVSGSTLSSVITNPDGTAVSELSSTSAKISDFTYTELMQWSVGYTKNPFFADAKILKMDDFLRVCAKTGMRPIFSVHPSLTTEQWQTIKGLTDKYGLTSQLSIKSGNYESVWKPVIDVFGDGNIHSIILLYSTTSTYDILAARTAGIAYAGIEKTPVYCEFFLEVVDADTSLGNTQRTQMQAVIDAGITCSGVMWGVMSSGDLKKYMNMGVTEFTNSRHCSLGLNW